MKLFKYYVCILSVLLTIVISTASYGQTSPQKGSVIIADQPSAGAMVLFDGKKVAGICYDSNEATVCRIVADCLANDFEQVTGKRPVVSNKLKGVKGNVIILGTIGSGGLVDKLVAQKKIDVSFIDGQWETFQSQVVDKPFKGISKALVIAGSDRRGTAFGVFDLSEQIGVSPFNWWADVPALPMDYIAVKADACYMGPPSVKYRGFFINDEDWGLHPWSRDNFSPEDEFVGPKTYTKVYELLLRLKANYIWPAMHECTKSFNIFEANKHVADDYAIVAGSSHCEQMLRNNTREWYLWEPADGTERGHWDWCQNSEHLIEYWRDRVKVNGPYESVYTLGMRGIHDSGMPCSGKDNHQKMLAMQNEIFPAQRQMLKEFVNDDVTKVAQIFCPYKEVLGLYRLGMDVPDDVTLVWPDDNHGYIRYLSTPEEQKRGGRAGVYYHVSYWGEPEDYLWLCSTPPALILEEMKKAYAYGADRVWVLNVGDIKPAEIATEFFLELGWDIDSVNFDNIDQYLGNWAGEKFPAFCKDEIADILYKYYQLGQQRKPEHTVRMGIGFSYINDGDEAQRRVDSYKELDDRALAVYHSLPEMYRDAFYQLVLYPVRCAGLVNEKILQAGRSRFYAQQGRVIANDLAKEAKYAYDQVEAETEYYNKRLADGKWDGMISSHPRDRQAFRMPDVGSVKPVNGASMGVVLEGQSRDLAAADIVAGEAFSDDFTMAELSDWSMTTPSRWEVRKQGDSVQLAINTTDFEPLSGDRLGEIALLKDRWYGDFELDCLVGSVENFNVNSAADLAIVFGYVDERNYNYMILTGSTVNTALFSVVNGNRKLITNCQHALTRGGMYPVKVVKKDGKFTVSYRGRQILDIKRNFADGAVGIGSYNDMASFAKFSVKPLNKAVLPDNSLPIFDVYTDNSYFVDIFNKGDKSFDYSISSPNKWISFTPASGNIEGQRRVELSINWAKAPSGTASGLVTVSGAGKDVTFNVKAFKPASPSVAEMENTAVMINGYACVEAENYSGETPGAQNFWKVIPTLGRTGNAVIPYPFTFDSITDVAKLSDTACLEYDFYTWENSSDIDVNIYCLPTHAANAERKLCYAVAVDGGPASMVEFDTEEYSHQWSVNVINGAALTTSKHKLSGAGRHKVKVWATDPGLILDKLVIGKLPETHCGPAETVVK